MSEASIKSRISIDRNSPVPLHYQVKELLLAEIESGRLTPGEQIPTEKELEETNSVSRTTVRQAVDSLVKEGLLYRRHGVGTFVAEPKLEYALGKLTSFTDDIRRRGFEPDAQVLEMAQESPSEFVQKELGLEEEARVIRLVRLRLADGRPVGLHTGFFPASAGLNIEVLGDELSDNPSVYAVIKSKGVSLIEAKETIEAVPADELESELLEVPSGAPLLLVRRTTYSNEQIPIEYCKMVYRADRYRYRIHLSS